MQTLYYLAIGMPGVAVDELPVLGLLGPIGPTELIIIGIIGLLIFGKRLPEIARNMGKGVVEFKKGLKGIEHDIEKEDYEPPPPSKNKSYNEESSPKHANSSDRQD